MLSYMDIVGQDEVVSHIRNSLLVKHIAHAYIFEGPTGCGKRTVAGLFAASLQCENAGVEPCGKCHSCAQSTSNSHPDVIRITPEKGSIIKVDEIRDRLVKDMAVKPYSGNYKIYIVEGAQNMNESAQNALLKTLEEPPEYGVIMLLTTNAEKLLPTIRSRCVTLKFRPVPDDKVRSFLIEKRGVSTQKADICAAFAQGVIGRALLLAESPEFMEIRESAIELMKRVRDIDSYEMASAVEAVGKLRTSPEDYLDILAVWYKDVLRFKATQDPDGLVFKDEVMEIRKQSNLSSYSGIENIIEALAKARERLRANVNFALTMELLLETIKENQS